MSRIKFDYYTLVRHSAHYNDNPAFAAAVETKRIGTTAELAQVGAAGGLIYNSYGEADSAEAAVNFPPEAEGIVPKARGTFSTVALDGRHIYLREK